VGDYRFYNERVTKGIIRCLLEYFSAAGVGTAADAWSTVHCECANKNVKMVVFLFTMMRISADRLSFLVKHSLIQLQILLVE